MKVEKQVGWLRGISGTGNIFELSYNGQYLLAMIWEDSKFHYLDEPGLNKQLQEGSAAIDSRRVAYLTPDQFPQNPDGSLTVTNPDGWQRLHGSASAGGGGQETTTTDQIVIPVSISFSGELKINLAGFGALLKLIE
ncbi:hypothetical protein [Dyadobacter bucti]|uniref:hypothetical protein n=1 Tax=Dyadobacter bucti TaxID=2572203 RepID=UPI003F72254C